VKHVDIDYLTLYGRGQYISCVKSDIELPLVFIQVIQLYAKNEGAILQYFLTLRIWENSCVCCSHSKM